jgi:hypothetical protein
MQNSQISERESVVSNQLDKLNHGLEASDTRPESFEGAARAALDSPVALSPMRIGRLRKTDCWSSSISFVNGIGKQER